MGSAVGAWVDEVLGPHAVVDRVALVDRKDARGQQVRRLECHRGERWILKRVAVAAEWEAEDRAYRQWLPAAGDHVPALVASDAGLRTVLVSELPGDHPGAGDAVANRRAGAVLRRLHDAVPAQRRPPDHSVHVDRRVERLLSEAHDVLTPSERSFVRAETAPLAELTADPRLTVQVPCHGDYRRHNWVVDGHGRLRVIDFGKSRWEAPVWDLTRLFLRPWWHRPRLATAFLDGYGRRLSPAEAEFVQRRMVVDALSHVAFGARRGSDRHVCFGRERLAELIAGHRVVRPRHVEAA